MEDNKKDRNQIGCLIALVIGLGIILLAVIIIFIFVVTSKNNEEAAGLNYTYEQITCSAMVEKQKNLDLVLTYYV